MKLETGKTTEKIHKTKSYFSEKINTVDKLYQD
jgi:hypothetical protein